MWEKAAVEERTNDNPSCGNKPGVREVNQEATLAGACAVTDTCALQHDGGPLGALQQGMTWSFILE